VGSQQNDAPLNVRSATSNRGPDGGQTVRLKFTLSGKAVNRDIEPNEFGDDFTITPHYEFMVPTGMQPMDRSNS
jgi:hypothetical protein